MAGIEIGPGPDLQRFEAVRRAAARKLVRDQGRENLAELVRRKSEQLKAAAPGLSSAAAARAPAAPSAGAGYASPSDGENQVPVLGRFVDLVA